MNSISLDLSDPALAKAVSDCVIGQPKELRITVIPTVHDDATFEAEVTKVSYASPKPKMPMKHEDDMAEGEMPAAVRAVSGAY